MDSIDKQCKVMKNLDTNSTAVFGGLPVVIVLGDFHQFSPVRAKALWQKQESHEEERGQQLWHMFKDVVVLDEQMRQQQDVEYYQLLKRVRNGTVNQADVDLLNSSRDATGITPESAQSLHSTNKQTTTCYQPS